MKTAERLLNDAREQNMPVFVLVAKDKCSLRAISSYCAECFKEGCPEHFIFEIDEVYKEFKNWQLANPDKIKLPD